ncbi:hypothetical protein LX32DRAFT_99109 [Colletotrichum zoysiae]|uniref:Uncharacterized protein n=1 Tax=Colletotrichum zoysiae TaxID=1216348 RepID=A0AAD9HAC8_9PEZI|nr:hypothetical protein LX32DRAFT_99109 [Colletotrichum zoysiae]
MLSYNETKIKHQIPASSALLAILFYLFVNHATPCQPRMNDFEGMSCHHHHTNKQACPARLRTQPLLGGGTLLGNKYAFQKEN